MLHRTELFIIDKIIIENKLVKTFWLKSLKKKSFPNPKPGQFIMLWLTNTFDSVAKCNGDGLHILEPPDIDDEGFKILDNIPMSISDYHDNKIAITVKNVGYTTEELHKYSEKSIIGLMGPLGNSFQIRGKHVLMVAGGMGIAPLSFLIKKMKKESIKIDLLLGVKTNEEMLLIDKIKPYCNNVNISSDDGTCGCKGLVSDLIPEIYNGHDQIYTCGPEKMMKCVLDFSIEKNVPAQFSLERFMHCGMGICGFCSLDGHLVCKEGPIFNSKLLKDVKEFGSIRKKASGRSEKI